MASPWLTAIRRTPPDLAPSPHRPLGGVASPSTSQGRLEVSGRFAKVVSPSRPGYFGEEVLAGARQHSESVTAISHAVVHSLTVAELEAICRHFPEQLRNFVEAKCARPRPTRAPSRYSPGAPSSPRTPNEASRAR